jgi:hypothetical protein
MPRSVMPRPSTRVRSYAAIACIPCSVAARACPFSFCSLTPMSMMLPLLAPSSNGPCVSTPSARASSAWNPKRQKNRSCLPPTWTKEELGKRTSIERFFGSVFLFFHLQRPPLWGWSAIERQVAFTYAASIIVGLTAQQAGRPDLIRSPKRVLAHTWEGL